MPISFVLQHVWRTTVGVEHVMMRRAIKSAKHPAGAMECAVTGGIAERRLLVSIDHDEQSTRAAAKLPSPPESGRNRGAQKNSGNRGSITSGCRT